MKLDVRDLLAAFSLANLSLIGWWDGLLNYTPAQAFLLQHPPPRTEYAAALANVVLIGLVYFLLIRLARWIAQRYGTAGVICGSVPILLLIAIPPAKSIVRLLANRFPDWDLTMVVAALAILLAATIAVTRQRFLQFTSAVLVTISPLILIEAILSISRCSTDTSAQFADGPLASRVPNSKPRVVWIIFDELDYRLAFVDRPSNVPMREFDRLAATSLFAENAVSPARDTLLSVPSLLTGKSFETVDPQGPASVLVDDKPLTSQPTIFSSVHAMGANAAAVGWYLPYCRLFSRDLAACSAHDLENELSDTGNTFARSLILQEESLYAYRYRSLLGQSPRAKHHLKMMSEMHSTALRDAADPSLNLVFLHLPVPHAPYLYDRFTYTYPARYLGVGNYLDNLALADNYLGDLRQAIEDAGLWDKTTVLVSSDHPDRMSMFVDGKEDPRVPFLLKLAGQSTGATYRPLLRTVVTKPLLEAVLEEKITTPEEARTWLESHH